MVALGVVDACATCNRRSFVRTFVAAAAEAVLCRPARPPLHLNPRPETVQPWNGGKGSNGKQHGF